MVALCFLNDGYREERKVREEGCHKCYSLLITLAQLSVFPEGVTLPDSRKNVDPRKLFKLGAKNVCGGEKIYTFDKQLHF